MCHKLEPPEKPKSWLCCLAYASRTSISNNTHIGLKLFLNLWDSIIWVVQELNLILSTKYTIGYLKSLSLWVTGPSYKYSAHWLACLVTLMHGQCVNALLMHTWLTKKIFFIKKFIKKNPAHPNILHSFNHPTADNMWLEYGWADGKPYFPHPVVVCTM